MTIRGSEENKRFRLLKIKRWQSVNDDIWTCTFHKTFFNPNREPCWQCYNEAVSLKEEDLNG